MSRRRVCELHGPGCRGPWSSLSSRERARITALVLEVKGRTCWVKGCTAPATSPDHIVPDSVSHDHRLENLRPSCLPHNQSRGNAPSGDGTYGARLTIITDPAAVTDLDYLAVVIDSAAIAQALDLHPTHPVVRAAMSAATRAAAGLTTPGLHVIVRDPAASPLEVDRLAARGATVIGTPTPHPPTPQPSRAW